MKYSITLAFIVTILVVFQSFGAETSVKVNSDDLQLEIAFEGGAHSTPGLDDDIDCYLTDLTSNRTIEIVDEPEPSYFYRAELFDTNGVAVPKTQLGQTVGLHFGNLDPEVGLKISGITFKQRGFSYGYTGGAVSLVYNGNEINAYKCNFAYGHARCSIHFPALKLFNVSSVGEYRLRLTYQVFELIDNHAIKLVRFPTIEEKITVTSQDLMAMKSTAKQETIPTSASTSATVHAQAVPSLQVKSSKVLNTAHPTLAFAGYDSPDSALESWIWACFQGDKTNMLQSLTPEEQEDYKHAFDGKTDAQIKDVASKIGSQFSGYTIQKMDIVSDTHVILNYTFAGSDLLLKMVINKIGNEWKVAGPSPDSAVISVSVPSQKINAEKH